MAIIIPGILTTREDEYEKRLKVAEHVCDLIQIDLVDGKFAKNTTVGVETIKKYPTTAFLEIQLMVVDPIKYVEELAGIDFVSKIIFPLEIDEDINNIIYKIKSYGRSVGLSLNPDTPISSAIGYFENIDLLLLMTGSPGFSGQKLGADTYKRIGSVKEVNRNMPVEIDIGVNERNAESLAKTGADFLVASSALYGAPDFRIAYEKLSNLAATYT